MSTHQIHDHNSRCSEPNRILLRRLLFTHAKLTSHRHQRYLLSSLSLPAQFPVIVWMSRLNATNCHSASSPIDRSHLSSPSVGFHIQSLTTNIIDLLARLRAYSQDVDDQFCIRQSYIILQRPKAKATVAIHLTPVVSQLSLDNYYESRIHDHLNVLKSRLRAPCLVSLYCAYVSNFWVLAVSHMLLDDRRYMHSL